MNIVDCEDCNIYIDSNVEVLKISACINCHIFVAAVDKICTIEKCENVTLCVAANQLRIGNCVDSTVHCYTPNLSPVVYGDTRNLRMAPHNASYPMLTQHLKRASIPFEETTNDKKPSDWFTEQINNFRKPMQFSKGDRSERTESSNSKSFSIMHEVDFNKLVLPNIIQEGNEDQPSNMLAQFNLLLCPIEYKEQL